MKILKQVPMLFNRALLFCLMTLTSIVAFAQEKGVDVNVDIDKKDGNWYGQPWVWVVGIAVFILLLVALLRGRGRD